MFSIKARIKEIKAIKRAGEGRGGINNAKQKRANLSTCAAPAALPLPFIYYRVRGTMRIPPAEAPRNLLVKCALRMRPGKRIELLVGEWQLSAFLPFLFATHSHGWPHGGERGIQQKHQGKKKGGMMPRQGAARPHP